MSNFPLSYKLSWLPHFLRPSLDGNMEGFAPPAGILMPTAPEQTVRLVFLGDISAVANSRPPEICGELAALIASADLVIGNCESPVVRQPRSRLRTRLGTHHAMDAGFLLGVLAALGLDPGRLWLSLANNHALDQGTEGFLETLETLGTLGIGTIGAAASGPVTTLQVGPVRVGIVAFTDWRNAAVADFEQRIVMTDHVTGEGWRSVDAAHADLLCAVPHWDWEFRHFPRDETRALARWLTEKGVGLIAGHHAHVVQPAERIGGAVVAYGLGDFLGTAFSRQPWPGRIGAVLVADISADAATRGWVSRYELVPFMRLRGRKAERLLQIGALEEPLRKQVAERVETVLGRV